MGAARTSMVTYVIPVVGLVLGAAFLNEQADARLILGAAMILGSIVIVNLNVASLFRRVTQVPAAIARDAAK